ncbi:prepilin peptidase [Microbacterium sp. STN6]|uniref:prepilin peptidase n=1 Tax=Microbacterium sp. STN6 TaxID=2995588 RepID=UPI002260F1C8|nr:A24 family peptidase [Microbacterium sp. STN6]MCX7523189.1 prepilin peptidase [Microbacterium sp. STN6]
MTALLLVPGFFGLLIGSFLNVVVYRVPNGGSIVSPPSACPGCASRIAWYDNIPVVSWLALRGRCRSCGNPISARYPLVELGTAVLFALVAVVFGPPLLTATTPQAAIAAALVLVAFLYLVAITVALALIDLDAHVLPNAIVLPSYLVAAALLGVAGALAGDGGALIRAGISMAALVVAYLVMALAVPGGMGLGDVKLAGVLGIYLGFVGWGALAVGALAAFVLGGLYGCALILARRAKRTSGIPFGPWMLVGAWVGIVFGNSISAGYLALFGFSGAGLS